MRLSEKRRAKLDRDIEYIKSEVADDRDVTSSLCSAGYTFLSDIERLAEYARLKGDIEFAELINKTAP
jgi:hypothetical protein